MSIQQLPGGHCFICHQDFEEERKDHPCFDLGMLELQGKAQPCGERCRGSKYYTPSFDRLLKKQ